MSFIEVFQTNYLLIIAFFFISSIYSSVGFGGGSSYLALLSLTAIPFMEYKSIALICNIIVVSGGTYLYLKNNLLNWKKIIPLVVLSIPMAYLGGLLFLEKKLFLIVLGITLILASGLMLSTNFKNKIETTDKSFKENSPFKNVIIGGIIGFISGLVGIGGGIFLSPILHLTKWDSIKKIGATSSFFILVNSVSGLIGQVQSSDFKINFYLIITLIVTVLIGGQIGSRVSIKVLNPKTIHLLTAILIGFVGIKILV